MTISIILHGGAKTIEPEKAEANRVGCLAAIEAGWTVLRSGGSAREAVEVTIRHLEADPTFNAGIGATLNTARQACLDAAIMEGKTLRWGAVAGVQRVRHPICAANLLMDEKRLLLVAEGAEHYAEEHGCEMCYPDEHITVEQKQVWEEETEVVDRPATVGCVALDHDGVLVAGTSTGGVAHQRPGRVGDSAIVGSGLYANHVGACSTTGDGEAVMTVVLAKKVVDLLADQHDPNEAAQKAIDYLQDTIEGEAGCILIDPQGQIGWAHNSSHMAIAYMNEGLEKPIVCLKKDD